MMDVIITVAGVQGNPDSDEVMVVTQVYRFDVESVQDVQYIVAWAKEMSLAGGMMENSLNGSTSQIHDDDPRI